MKNITVLLLVSAVCTLSNDVSAWGFKNLEGDIKGVGKAVGSGAKTFAGGLGAAATAVGNVVHDVYDATTSMCVSYLFLRGYFLGIKDMYIEFLVPSGTNPVVFLIKDGQFVKKGRMKDLFKHLSTGYNSTLASVIFSNNVTNSSTSLKFFLSTSTDSLQIVSSEKITTTNSQGQSLAGVAMGGSSYNSYSSSNSSSYATVKQIGSSVVKVPGVQSATGYKVGINVGSSFLGLTQTATSRTPMNRAFYINL